MRRLGMVLIGMALMVTVGLPGLASATPDPQAYNSAVVGSVQQLPGPVACGDPYTLSATFRDTGHAPWNSGQAAHVVATGTGTAFPSSTVASITNPHVQSQSSGTF